MTVFGPGHEAERLRFLAKMLEGAHGFRSTEFGDGRASGLAAGYRFRAAEMELEQVQSFSQSFPETEDRWELVAQLAERVEQLEESASANSRHISRLLDLFESLVDKLKGGAQ